MASVMTLLMSLTSGCDSTFDLFDCAVDPARRHGDFSADVVDRLVGELDVGCSDSSPIVWR